MATKNSTEIDLEEFDHWLSELFIATKAMEYLLKQMPDEKAELSSALTTFRSHLSELLIEGHEYWIGTTISFSIKRLAAMAQRRVARTCAVSGTSRAPAWS